MFRAANQALAKFWLNPQNRIPFRQKILVLKRGRGIARTTTIAGKADIRRAPDPFDFAQGRLFASSG
jgi:hypothetical protein